MTFPEEIWTQIFSHLIPQNDPLSDEKYYPYRPLRTLCLVSRRFRRLAQPILHHTVFMVDDKNWINREIKLLRTLHQSPSLARAVRSLSVISFPKLVEPPTFPGVAKLVEDVLRSLDIPSLLKRQLEIKPFSNESVDGVPMILALTTAVQHVDVTISDSHWHKRIAHQLAGSMQPGEPDPSRNYSHYGLPNLKDISINARYSPVNTGITSVEPVLRRSDVTSLRLAWVNWHSAWEETVPRPGNNFSLHSLILDNCVVDEVTLKDILTWYPKLRRLSLNCADGNSAIVPTDDEDDETPWTWRSSPFGDVLREYGKYLEEFTLLTDYHRERSYAHGIEDDETVLGSLHELPSLRKMEVSFQDLFGDEDSDGIVNMDMNLLPPNLEEIVIPSSHDAYFDEAIAVIRSNSLPKLRRVTLRFTCRCLWDLSAIPDEEIPGWTYLEWKLLDKRPIKVRCLNFVKLPIEQNAL
ncbi:unnamed protein product [Clonostachys solani]|uniref:F-box domain-containing protein n=1 Tax=Clonostachys solani TaxID=160281 RepID=A0A9N9ZMX5_9HYPO|nr:unnamed protein product [Clonostachys solani]